jgi:hypothetical protein
MGKETVECLRYLEAVRSKWMEGPNFSIVPKGLATLEEGGEVEILGKKFQESVWSQRNNERSLVIFELSRKAFIGSIHNCLGVEKSHEGKISLLSNKDLWKLGIP